MAGIRKFGSKVDLQQNELLNAVIQILAGAPGTPKEGQIYFDSTKHQFGYYNGTEWVYGATVAEATEAATGTIKLAEDLKGGTAAAPKVSGLHLTADTAIGHRLTTVTDPTEAQDAATKKYVLEQISAKLAGLNWKEVVRLTTAAALPACTPEGEALKSTGKELLEVDGVAAEVGDRILVKNQVAAKDDGIYSVVKIGSGAEFWELKRTADANTTKLLQDAAVFTAVGTANLGHEFIQTAKVTTVGTTNQTWVEFQSGLTLTTEATYLERSSNELKIKKVTANQAVVPAEGAISAAIRGNGRVANFAFQLKAGVTELELEHVLETYQVQVTVQANNAGKPGEPIELAWEPTTENKIKITWPVAPAATTVYFVSIVG
jgi:hypothetical protein